jgi:hypothetical protein
MGAPAKFTREVTSRGLSSTAVLIMGYRNEFTRGILKSRARDTSAARELRRYYSVLEAVAEWSYIMRIETGSRFDYDPVAWAFLIAGIGAVAWLALSI